MARLLALVGVGRATLTDDSKEVQLVQLTEGFVGTGGANRITDKVPRVMEFGFTSTLPEGSEIVVIRGNGERSRSIAIASQHRDSRPTDLKAGDTAIYDVRGRIMKLTADGIEIDAAGGPVTIKNASKVRCECDVETTGDVISRADGTKVSLNKLYDAYNAHTHPPAAKGGQWGSGPPDKKA
ncbi:phage baseplate assembly protein [Sphingomonas sp. CBMAI 2297]|uniref:phage baseplate assembly protein domain-containing protein n=1 Tax=Sphingomonas sp. CBMAI 2297 TaxID=2991720 RepID=UPI002454067E|nr:phage baseplate assembly protein [Sphingomonas sp. CBMAI 2297]MDH4745817.1 phage baseplate assembly protein [Sphingomonas sp. CBMAI 2297]